MRAEYLKVEDEKESAKDAPPAQKKIQKDGSTKEGYSRIKRRKSFKGRQRSSTQNLLRI